MDLMEGIYVLINPGVVGVSARVNATGPVPVRARAGKIGVPERKVPSPGAFRSMVQCLFYSQTFTVLVCGPAASC